jgi:arylformamidase
VVAVEADGPIEAGALPTEALRAGHRLLLRTPNSDTRVPRAEFDPRFAAIAPSAADAIAAAGIALVGIDYLSVESPEGGGVVHRRLLEAGVVLLEGLDLRGVEPGEYKLSALPVRWVGGEAAPVRAVLWR